MKFKIVLPYYITTFVMCNSTTVKKTSVIEMMELNFINRCRLLLSFDAPLY
jgi:hypothetical protein